MARYRKIDPRVWNDEKFRRFTDDGKLGFLFVLTHPSMTAIGGMRATVAGLAAELRWAPARLSDAIGDAIRHGMLDVDEEACFVGAPKFLRYNEPEGPNSVSKAWVEALDLVPECPAKQRLIARCRAYLDGRSKAFRDALSDAIWDAFPVAKGDASPIQEQEQEQEQEPKKKRSPRVRASGGAELPGAGGGNRIGPKDDAARVNAAEPEGSAPAAQDGGEAASAGIAEETRGAPGPAHPSKPLDGVAAAMAGAPEPGYVPEAYRRRGPVEDDLPAHPLVVEDHAEQPGPDGVYASTGRISPLPRRGELAPTLRAEEWPLTLQVLEALWAGGWEAAAWPKSRQSAAEVEEAIRVATVPAAVERLLAYAARERAAGLVPKPWLGWHTDVILGRSRSPSPVRDIRVGHSAPAPASQFQEGEYDLARIPAP